MRVKSELSKLAKLAAFATWLPKHAGVVGSINIETVHSSDHTTDDDAANSIATSLVELSFQRAAAGVQSARWRLRSLVGGGIISPNVLSALPVAQLTTLNILLPQVNEQNCLAAIGLLTNLRELILESEGFMPPSSLQHLASLSQLTWLDLDIISSSDFTLLPPALRNLHLQLDHAAAVASDLNLQHLTCLERLELCCMEPPPASSQLPRQLQHLSILVREYPAIQTFNIAALQHLQQLVLHDSRDTVDDYNQLHGLTQLQHVDLHNPNPGELVEGAPLWKALPKLASFLVAECKLPAAGLQRLAEQLSAATGLTKLDLGGVEVRSSDEADLQGRSVCEHLASLTNLRCLRTWCGEAPAHSIASGGGQHLSALTALTKLDVSRGLPALDETDAALLALKLTSLEWLAFGEDSYNKGWSTAPLPVIGHLTRLQHLNLGDLSAQNAKRGLSCLVALTRLTHLGGFKAAGSDAVEDFWATLNSNIDR